MLGSGSSGEETLGRCSSAARAVAISVSPGWAVPSACGSTRHATTCEPPPAERPAQLGWRLQESELRPGAAARPPTSRSLRPAVKSRLRASPFSFAETSGETIPTARIGGACIGRRPAMGCGLDRWPDSHPWRRGRGNTARRHGATGRDLPGMVRRRAPAPRSSNSNSAGHVSFPLPLEELAAQRRLLDASGHVPPRPTDPIVARRRGEEPERRGRALPGRASILAMVASNLTINAWRPESVRVRLHLRWPGSLPGRVQVNAPARFRHESVQTNWFHAPAGRRGPARPRAPSGRARPALGSAPAPGSPAWSDGASAAKPSSNRPRIVLEPSSNRPRRIRPAFLTARTTPRPRGGRPFARRPPAEPPPPTRRSPASFWCATRLAGARRHHEAGRTVEQGPVT
jgi:hypothetical protein